MRGDEEQRSVDVHQLHGIRAFDVWDVWGDVDHHRAGFSPVASPQLHAMCFVIGREEQRAIDVHQFHRNPARPDLLHQLGTGVRAVTFPESGTANRVHSREVQRVIKGCPGKRMGRKRKYVTYEACFELGREATANATVIVHDRQCELISVGRRTCRIVVQILVRLGEAGRPRSIRKCLRRTLTPIHGQREGILRAWIDNITRQRDRVVLVNRGRNGQVRQLRRHVADGRSRVAGAGSRVVVGQYHADRVHVAGRAGRVVVQVLVRNVERTTADRYRLRRPLAPIDRQLVRIQRTHVAVRARQMQNAIFVHGCGAKCLDHWGHVVDRDCASC